MQLNEITTCEFTVDDDAIHHGAHYKNNCY